VAALDSQVREVKRLDDIISAGIIPAGDHPTMPWLPCGANAPAER
jgi:hypothetical protein